MAILIKEISTEQLYTFYEGYISVKDFYSIMGSDSKRTPVKGALLDAVKSKEITAEEAIEISEKYDSLTALEKQDLNNKIKKKEINLNDINSLKNGVEDVTYNNVKEFTMIDKETILLYEDDTWYIISPLSPESSRKHCSKSHWCTASASYDYYFPQYTVDRNACLISFFNKKNEGHSFQIAIDINKYVNNQCDFADNSVSHEWVIGQVGQELYDKVTSPEILEFAIEKTKRYGSHKSNPFQRMPIKSALRVMQHTNRNEDPEEFDSLFRKLSDVYWISYPSKTSNGVQIMSLEKKESDKIFICDTEFNLLCNFPVVSISSDLVDLSRVLEYIAVVSTNDSNNFMNIVLPNGSLLFNEDKIIRFSSLITIDGKTCVYARDADGRCLEFFNNQYTDVSSKYDIEFRYSQCLLINKKKESIFYDDVIKMYVEIHNAQAFREDDRGTKMNAFYIGVTPDNCKNINSKFQKDDEIFKQLIKDAIFFIESPINNRSLETSRAQLYNLIRSRIRVNGFIGEQKTYWRVYSNNDMYGDNIYDNDTYLFNTEDDTIEKVEDEKVRCIGGRAAAWVLLSGHREIILFGSGKKVDVPNEYTFLLSTDSSLLLCNKGFEVTESLQICQIISIEIFTEKFLSYTGVMSYYFQGLSKHGVQYSEPLNLRYITCEQIILDRNNSMLRTFKISDDGSLQGRFSYDNAKYCIIHDNLLYEYFDNSRLVIKRIKEGDEIYEGGEGSMDASYFVIYNPLGCGSIINKENNADNGGNLSSMLCLLLTTGDVVPLVWNGVVACIKNGDGDKFTAGSRDMLYLGNYVNSLGQDINLYYNNGSNNFISNVAINTEWIDTAIKLMVDQDKFKGYALESLKKNANLFKMAIVKASNQYDDKINDSDIKNMVKECIKRISDKIK